MKKLLILSGKGGTGKTTTAAAFVKFASSRALCDCDVDAPNLHIVSGSHGAGCGPDFGAGCGSDFGAGCGSDYDEEIDEDFYGSVKSFIDGEACVGCKMCLENCRFGAISYSNGKCQVNEYSCEGCGVCQLVCKAGAVSLKDDIAGKIKLFKGKEKTFATAKLKMGRGNSGKLVTSVKNTLFKNVSEDLINSDSELAIIDGSPGIGCPVIASIGGVDGVLIVTEPTKSGLSDLKRLVQSTKSFGVKTMVCVNRWDISPEHTEEIKEFCNEADVIFAGKVPYDKAASAAINSGKSIADIDCKGRDGLLEVYEVVSKNMGM